MNSAWTWDIVVGFCGGGGVVCVISGWDAGCGCAVRVLVMFVVCDGMEMS